MGLQRYNVENGPPSIHTETGDRDSRRYHSQTCSDDEKRDMPTLGHRLRVRSHFIGPRSRQQQGER